MVFDKPLVGKVRQAVKDCSPTRLQFAEDKIKEYETACVLSRGQDPNRNQHWELIARQRRNYLQAMLGD